MSLDEVVPPALAGERLDRVVSLVADCSRAEASGWVTDARVAVDGIVVTTRARRLVVGERVTIDVPDAAEESVRPDDSVIFTVVAADDDVIVVDKPAGLVVHPGSGHPDGTLVNGLLARFPEIAEVGQPLRPGIVHRLDRGTSGLVVVARTERAYEALVGDLAAHRVEREYAAMVVGRPEPGRGVIDAPIGRSSRSATRMTVTAAGKHARTHFEVVEHFDGPVVASLIDCALETGRTHQIRVHLAAIDHPVLGDDTYGGKRPEAGLTRPFLHAQKLAFTHPATGAHVEYTSPLPDDLVSVLDRFRAYDE